MQNRTFALVVRYLLMFFGLFLLSLGILLSVNANLGASAWTVFHLGIAKHIGWTQGQVSQVVGLLIVGFSYLMGIKPAIATVANMILVGGVYDLLNSLQIVPTPSSLVLRSLLLLLSIFITSAGTSLYISVRLGAGPRDSLMLALTKRTGWRIGLVRNSIELGVLAIGIILGGPFGAGTVLYALAIGPALEGNMHLLRTACKRWHLEAYLTVMEAKRKQRPAGQAAVGND